MTWHQDLRAKTRKSANQQNFDRPALTDFDRKLTFSQIAMNNHNYAMLQYISKLINTMLVDIKKSRYTSSFSPCTKLLMEVS